MRNLVKIVLILCLSYIAFLPANASGQFFFFLDENTNVGKPMPDMELASADGANKKVSDLIKDKEAIVYFWARWCPPCREHLKELRTQQKEFKEKGIAFVLISMGETPESATKYLKKYKLDLPVLTDFEENSMDPYEIVGLPTFYFVNKEGLVTAVEHELPENFEEIVKQKI